MKNKTYIELIGEKGNTKYIASKDKLDTEEWRLKREKILNRDNHNCCNCNSEKTIKRKNRHYRKATLEETEINRIQQQKIQDEYTKELMQVFKSISRKEIILKSEKRYGADTIKTDNPIILHVHHKYYIKGKLPWEYADESLITLCQNCHQKVHDETEIPEYINEKMLEVSDLNKCIKCNGSGYIKTYHYYKNGICFRCNGNKYEEYIEK